MKTFFREMPQNFPSNYVNGVIKQENKFKELDALEVEIDDDIDEEQMDADDAEELFLVDDVTNETEAENLVRIQADIQCVVDEEGGIQLIIGEKRQTGEQGEGENGDDP